MSNNIENRHAKNASLAAIHHLAVGAYDVAHTRFGATVIGGFTLLGAFSGAAACSAIIVPADYTTLAQTVPTFMLLGSALAGGGAVVCASGAGLSVAKIIKDSNQNYTNDITPETANRLKRVGSALLLCFVVGAYAGMNNVWENHVKEYAPQTNKTTVPAPTQK